MAELVPFPKMHSAWEVSKNRTHTHIHTHRSYIYTFRGGYVSPGCTLRQMRGRQAADAHKLGLKTSCCPTWTNHGLLLTDTKREKPRDWQEEMWTETCASHIRASFNIYRVMMSADWQDSQLSCAHHINYGIITRSLLFPLFLSAGPFLVLVTFKPVRGVKEQKKKEKRKKTTLNLCACATRVYFAKWSDIFRWYFKDALFFTC